MNGLEKQNTMVPQWLDKGAAISWRLLIVGTVIYLVARELTHLEVIVVPIAAALFLSTILAPPAQWLHRKHVPAILATWIVMLSTLGIATAAVLGVYPSIRSEFIQLASQLNVGLRDIRNWLQTGPLHLSSQQLDSYVGTLSTRLDQYRNALLKSAVTGLTTVVEILAGILLSFVLTFFFVKDGERIGDWFVSLFEVQRSLEVRALGRRSWATLSGYVRGTAVNGVANATVMSIGLLLIGVPLVTPIALLTFVGGFLPLVGAIISGGVAATMALVAKGPLAAGLVLTLTVVIHQLEGYIVGPLVLGRAVKLHPVAILLSLSVGTSVGGIVGAFVAVPFTAILAEMVSFYRGEGPSEASLNASPKGLAPKAEGNQDV